MRLPTLCSTAFVPAIKAVYPTTAFCAPLGSCFCQRRTDTRPIHSHTGLVSSETLPPEPFPISGKSVLCFGQDDLDVG